MKTFDSHLAQPYWASSQRLLHPKCVWVECFGSYRHFIFDRSMSQYKKKMELLSQGELKIGSITATSTGIASRKQAIAYERFKSLDLNQNDYLTIIGSADLKLNRKKEIRYDNPHSRHETILEPIQWLNDTSSEFELSSIQSSNTDIQQLNNEIDLCNDLLAERVLQWLDLAENNNRTMCIKRNESIEKPMTKRHSFTAKETTKSTESQPSPRRESIHHLFIKFDENTVNVIQTDDIIPMSNGSVKLRFDQFFPTTYRCCRKFLSLRRTHVPEKLFDFNNNSTDHNSVLMLETNPHERKPMEMANQKQKQSGKFGVGKSKWVTGYFDDQYHSMIQRQILETSCNTQLAKRQLHIFMPNLPKKCSNDSQPNSRSANDCDSCISSHVSIK